MLVLRSPADLLLTVSDTALCTMIVSQFTVQSVLKCTGSTLVSFRRIMAQYEMIRDHVIPTH